jgi:chromosomal replication initiation ATPase DnaA
MNDNIEIELLLTNIQKSLKVYSVKELNNAFKEIISNKNYNTEDVSKVLNLVCEHFKITLSQLMSKDNRGKIIDAKQVAYCLLHFNLSLSVKQISKHIFKNWRNSVYRGINRYKNINRSIKEDDIFYNDYATIQTKFKLYKNKSK